MCLPSFLLLGEVTARRTEQNPRMDKLELLEKLT